mmetsp:Transcript_24083/g.34511  ORF Transcript_24083/g.34511 Transcript_24083/m.34511 type:complete len:184 (-) Transcript_24083:249-800(-)
MSFSFAVVVVAIASLQMMRTHFVAAVLIDHINEDSRTHTRIDICDVRLMLNDLHFSMEPFQQEKKISGGQRNQRDSSNINRQHTMIGIGKVASLSSMTAATDTHLLNEFQQTDWEHTFNQLSYFESQKNEDEELQLKKDREFQKVMEQGTKQLSSVSSTIEAAIKCLDPPVGSIRRGRPQFLQ